MSPANEAQTVLARVKSPEKPFLKPETAGSPSGAIADTDASEPCNSTEGARHAGISLESSNANYDLLGYLAQVVSGQAYGDYMRDHVFAPMGMTGTYTSHVEARAAGLASAYYPCFGLITRAVAQPAPG